MCGVVVIEGLIGDACDHPLGQDHQFHMVVSSSR
jgi:hypothetical protein